MSRVTPLQWIRRVYDTVQAPHRLGTLAGLQQRFLSLVSQQGFPVQIELYLTKDISYNK